jgi:chromosome partitioning protein
VSRILAVANQKGGVGKTTTVHSLGEALAEAGQRVLLVDLDPQACLTYSCGVEPDELERSLHEVLLGRATASEVLLKVGDVHLLPSSIDMAGAEVHLMTRTGREYTLQRALAPLLGDYDVVLIDCPPSLGILTVNGLTAAQAVVVPLQCETLSHRGVGQLLETVEDVRSFTNPDLVVRGVIATMFDGRTRLAHEVVADVGSRYGLEVLDPPVPKSVRVAEAPGRGGSVLAHAPRSASAEAYRTLAAVIGAS